MGSILSLQAVSFNYGVAKILNSVSLEVPQGCFVGLIGPNGSGKSTLLRIAAGLLKPASGGVSLEGRPIDGMSRSEIARKMALLPQSPSLPPAFTVEEIVLMGRAPFLGFLGREGAADYAVVERAMDQAECRGLARKRMDELSGGERQRVMIARALAQQPRMLLLDEPTAHMDLQHQLSVAEMVAGLVDLGLAALGVFHDLNLAAAFCDRLAVLSQGQLVAEGTPAEVLKPGLLCEVYQVGLSVSPHPDGHGPVVMLPGRSRDVGLARFTDGQQAVGGP